MRQCESTDLHDEVEYMVEAPHTILAGRVSWYQCLEMFEHGIIVLCVVEGDCVQLGQTEGQRIQA